MNNDLLNERLFDAMLSTAVQEDFQNEIDEIDWLPDKAHVFSDRHNLQIKKILARHKGARRKANVRTFLKRATIAVLVVMSIAFSGLMSIKTVRAELYRIVTEWYDEHIDIFFEPSNNDEISDDKNLRHSGARLPSYIPEDYELDELIKNSNAVVATYYNSSGEMLSFGQYVLPEGANISLNNEGLVIQRIRINGFDALLGLPHSSDDYSSILWTDNEYVYQITARLDGDTLILIAESLE